MKRKVFFWLALGLVSIVLFIGISYLRAFGFRLNILGGAAFGVIIYYLTVWRFKENYLTPLAILIAPHIIALLAVVALTILANDKPILALPGLFIVPFGTLVAYLVSNRSVLKKGLVYSLYAGFTLWLAFPLWSNLSHYHAYGTVSGIIDPIPIEESMLMEGDSSNFDFGHSDEIYLLNFWHTRCKFCFDNFPDFQKLYERSLEVDELNVLSVNQLLRDEEPGNIFNILEELEYSFPSVFFSGTREDLYDNYSVRGFPTYIIVKDYSIVFKGSLSNAERWLAGNVPGF